MCYKKYQSIPASLSIAFKAKVSTVNNPMEAKLARIYSLKVTIPNNQNMPQNKNPAMDIIPKNLQNPFIKSFILF